jgi:HEPN domain-containing protein
MSDPADLPRLLLGLARDDEFAARSLLPVEGVADSILGFHAQQAVEKSLKAALAYRGVEFPYTHDLDGERLTRR